MNFIEKTIILAMMTKTAELIRDVAKNLAVRSMFIEEKYTLVLSDMLKENVDALNNLRSSFLEAPLEEGDIERVLKALSKLESRSEFVEEKSTTLFVATMN